MRCCLMVVVVLVFVWLIEVCCLSVVLGCFYVVLMGVVLWCVYEKFWSDGLQFLCYVLMGGLVIVIYYLVLMVLVEGLWVVFFWVVVVGVLCGVVVVYVGNWCFIFIDSSVSYG